MENTTTTSNRNCLNMLSYTSILKQTVSKNIQNYHILEHVQWQHCELRAKLFVLQQYFNYTLYAAKAPLWSVWGIFLGYLRRNTNISSYYETYTFSINRSFLIFTFIPLFQSHFSELTSGKKYESTFFERQVQKRSRQKRKISSELFALCRTFNLFTQAIWSPWFPCTQYKLPSKIPSKSTKLN